MPHNLARNHFKILYEEFRSSLCVQPTFFKQRSKNILLARKKLIDYLEATSLVSLLQYFFYSGNNAYINKANREEIAIILNHINAGLIQSPEDLMLRLLAIKSHENECLKNCIDSVKQELRINTQFSSDQIAIATFLNTFTPIRWDLQHLQSSELFKIIETLSIYLIMNLHGLQSFSTLDSNRGRLFINNIQLCIDCFQAANKAFSAGAYQKRKELVIPTLKDFLTALSTALYEAAPLFSLKEYRDQCFSLAQKIPNLQYNKPVIICELDAGQYQP